MWKMFLIAVTCVGCVATGGERAAVQEVTGVTVTARDAGQLAVSWTADPLASRYLVYQSVGGSLPALVATVFDSTGGPPSTSWIATGLTGGVEYCYAIRSGFADGGVGAPGGATCGTAVSGAVSSGVRRRNVPLVLAWSNPTNTWAATSVGLRSVIPGGLNAGDGATSIDVPFEVGESVIGAEVWRFSDGSPGSKAALLALAAGSDFIIAAGDDSIGSAATVRSMYSIPAIAGVSPRTMAAGERLRLVLFGRTAGYTLDSVNLLYTAAP